MPVAVYNSSGLAYYRHSDWLGSSRFASTSTRALYFDGAYAPFGENYAQTGTTDLSFTGMNQDTVSNLFDFPAREYNAIHGRWPSPDPAGVSSVRRRDPQTMNRYVYVRNSPLKLTDPSGMDQHATEVLEFNMRVAETLMTVEIKVRPFDTTEPAARPSTKRRAVAATVAVAAAVTVEVTMRLEEPLFPSFLTQPIQTTVPALPVTTTAA